MSQGFFLIFLSQGWICDGCRDAKKKCAETEAGSKWGSSDKKGKKRAREEDTSEDEIEELEVRTERGRRQTEKEWMMEKDWRLWTAGKLNGMEERMKKVEAGVAEVLELLKRSEVPEESDRDEEEETQETLTGEANAESENAGNGAEDDVDMEE